MVLVVAFSSYVEVETGSIGKALEEMEEEFGRYITYALATELSIPHKPGASTEIEGYGGEAVVHGQREAIATDTAFVAKGLGEGFAKHDGSVFYGVVLVDM